MALGSASPVGSVAALAVSCARVIAGEGSAQTDSSLDPHETPNMLQALNRHNLIGLGFDRAFGFVCSVHVCPLRRWHILNQKESE